MSIPVIWLSYHEETPNRGYWDYGMLEDYFSRSLWNTVQGQEFQHINDFSELPKAADGAIVVLPARYHAGDIKLINNDLSKLKWCVLFLMGDEANVFPAESLTHPNMVVYVMTPKQNRHESFRLLGDGYPPQARELLKKHSMHADMRLNNWFFSGQVNTKRRQECVEGLLRCEIGGGIVNATPGFTQGMEHDKYFQTMAGSKVVVCPSGPQTPDTFRLFEALEAGCVPIADEITPAYDSKGYWSFLFGETPPFPILHDYDSLQGYISETLEGWPANSNKVFAWWQNYKRNLAYQIDEDINRVAGLSPSNIGLRDRVTVVIPTSPIPSHPSTEIIDETIASIRSHLADVEILITVDGVRPEQEHRRADYDEYIRKLLWKSNHEWNNVLPILFTEHMHQTGMAKAVLEYIKTPLLLYVEQDTPLTSDCEIDWNGICEAVLSGEVSHVRLNHEAHILDEHKYLMLDDEPQVFQGVPLIRTIQYSQRPHVASVAFYRRIFGEDFSEEAKAFIEDVMHGKVQKAWNQDRVMGWQNYRLAIYHPEGGNIKRSYHTDGRAGGEKYSESQVF